VTIVSGRNFRYTPFYCEENIWHLAQEKYFRGPGAFVVIISGEGGHRRLWFQSLAEGRESPVFWDYHVLLLVFDNGWHVWDLDTTLGLPVTAETYFQKTFLNSGIDLENCDVILRLIASASYVRSFSSDRSHMISPTGEWLAPPPAWPAITKGDKSNLLDWLDIGRDDPGQVHTLAEFMINFLTSDSRI
jgi:hypothetical protein